MQDEDASEGALELLSRLPLELVVSGHEELRVCLENLVEGGNKVSEMILSKMS
jgi:hypothetical protein